MPAHCAQPIFCFLFFHLFDSDLHFLIIFNYCYNFMPNRNLPHLSCHAAKHLFRPGRHLPSLPKALSCSQGSCRMLKSPFLWG